MTDAFAGHVSGFSVEGGRLRLTRSGEDPVTVTAHYLRPLTGRSEIVFLDEQQREVVSVASLDAVEPSERPLVEEALRARYHLVTVRRIDRIEVRFGTRYFEAETDRGPRAFALREPGKNVTALDDGRLVLRDTAGNRFEVPPPEALDAASRRWLRVAL